MTAVLVAGFGIVVAVNFTMAAYATNGFGGVVVDNSYRASQQYNAVLEEAERQQALGWETAIARGEEGQLVISTQGVPETATATAQLRRPLGVEDRREITLQRGTDGNFTSAQPVPAGRWIVRLSITAGEATFAQQAEIL